MPLDNEPQKPRHSLVAREARVLEDPLQMPSYYRPGRFHGWHWLEDTSCFQTRARVLNTICTCRGLPGRARQAHGNHMHIASMVVLTCGCWFSGPGWAADAFGSWKVNPARSTAPYAGALTVRIEPHSRGEVFSVDRVD